MNPTTGLEIEYKSSGACFPGDAKVILSNHRFMRMNHLRGGDMIKVSASGRHSKVFAFTHRDTYVNGKLRAASSVRLGKTMESESGNTIIVSGIRMLWKTGMYAPHTMHGDLVVNGVVVSSYTTEFNPAIAHALLTRVRLVSLFTGIKEPLWSVFYRGCGAFRNTTIRRRISDHSR